MSDFIVTLFFNTRILHKSNNASIKIKLCANEKCTILKGKKITHIFVGFMCVVSADTATTDAAALYANVVRFVCEYECV